VETVDETEGCADLAGAAIRPWSNDDTVFHGFLGRTGGVSRGAFSTLNLSHLVGDEKPSVDANWNRLLRTLPPHIVISELNQVHRNLVIIANRETARGRLEADGQVTMEPGLMLAIFTADCVPVLMHDPVLKAVGALHVGWRGAVANIADAGVTALTKLGARPSHISAALGPAIGGCCFEVGAEVAERFRTEVAGCAPHIRAGAKPGKSMIELKGIIRTQLERAGLESAKILDSAPCTRCHADRFFSRRAVGGQTTGLQLSFVGLRAERTRA
jgi:YfiH family protein